MGLDPENAGRPNAGSVDATLVGGETVYLKVPVEIVLKSKTKVPTLVAANAAVFQGCENGVPTVTYMSPLYCVGEAQLPTGITSQSGLKLPGDDVSAWRGS